MRWSKIKNIILLLLVIVNLALLVLVGLRTWRTAQNDRQAKERMIRILENNNITFQPGEVPDALTLTPYYLTRDQGSSSAPFSDALPLWTFRSGRAEAVDPQTLTGSWEPVSLSETPLTGSTALLRLLETVDREGYVFTSITGMYPGYTVSGTSTLLLTPAWFIEIDTRPWRFAVDGYTGAVTPAE